MFCIWVKGYIKTLPTDLFTACQMRKKKSATAAVFKVQEQWIKILNTAFEIASPKARKSQSIAFVWGPNSFSHQIFPSGSSHKHFTKMMPLKPCHIQVFTYACSCLEI